MMILAGMRTALLITPFAIEVRALEAIITTMVAKPNPRPLVALLVTANSGHNASDCLSTMLLSHMPAAQICRY